MNLFDAFVPSGITENDTCSCDKRCIDAGTTDKVTDAAAPAQAILRHMWSEARRQWEEQSRPTPTPSPGRPQ